MPSKKSAMLSKDHKLIEKFMDGSFKIAIYGLGHVGAPFAAAWLRAGCHVIGVDASSEVLTAARKGRILIPEPGIAEAYKEGLKTDRFEVSSDPIEASRKSYFKMVCVPVLNRNMSADLSTVCSVATSIGIGLKKGDIVSFNPSVPPGTTEDTVIPIIEKSSGLSIKHDFCMVYNPERIYEGRALKDIEENYPAIIASVGPNSVRISQALYSIIFKRGVLTISNIKAAEAEKLFEGIYRDVNIALANEMARMCERTGIDFWEARYAANSQPYCNIHKPGIGVGGACIPVYPLFILGLAERLNLRCKLTKMGRELNDSMPSYCVKEAMKLVRKFDSSNLNVTVLGLAFRGGVSDTRLSPTYSIIEELKKAGVKKIKIHDPLVTEDPNLDRNVTLMNNLKDSLIHCDLVIVAADHQEYRKLGKKELGKVVIYDGRGVIDRESINSLNYSGIGFKCNSKGNI